MVSSITQKVQRIGALVSLIGLATALPAAADESTFSGWVTHVSTNNIKVESPRHETLSFMIVPHFDHVFQFDGKTTYQMKRIRPGTFVRVYYDQHALGMRHADKIILVNHHHAQIGG